MLNRKRVQFFSDSPCIFGDSLIASQNLNQTAWLARIRQQPSTCWMLIHGHTPSVDSENDKLCLTLFKKRGVVHLVTFCFCWPALRASYSLVSDIGPSVRGHILKTTQDMPVFTMEHCTEVGIADYVAAFRSCPDASLGDILLSNVEKWVKILIRPAVRLWRQTTGVVDILKPSESVVNTDHPLCCVSLPLTNLYYNNGIFVLDLTTDWHRRSASHGVRFATYHTATKSLWSSRRTENRRYCDYLHRPMNYF